MGDSEHPRELAKAGLRLLRLFWAILLSFFRAPSKVQKAVRFLVIFGVVGAPRFWPDAGAWALDHPVTAVASVLAYLSFTHAYNLQTKLDDRETVAITSLGASGEFRPVAHMDLPKRDIYDLISIEFSFSLLNSGGEATISFPALKLIEKPARFCRRSAIDVKGEFRHFRIASRTAGKGLGELVFEREECVIPSSGRIYCNGSWIVTFPDSRAAALRNNLELSLTVEVIGQDLKKRTAQCPIDTRWLTNSDEEVKAPPTP